MRRAAALCVVCLLLAAGAAGGADRPRFVDVTTRSGIPAVRFGEGVNAVDLDGDGLPELFLPCVRGRDRLYRNLGSLRFADVTEARGITGSGGIGAAIGDLDRDGRPDIAVVRGAWPSGGVSLLAQQADGTFRDVAEAAGIRTRRNGIAPAMADVDADGRPDLFVSGWGGDLLFRGTGGRPAFSEVAREAGLDAGGRSWGGLFTDLTGDGLPDLLVARGGKGIGETARLFVNLRAGRFEDRTATTDLARGGWAMGAVALDCDGDGDQDLFVTQYEGNDRLYRNDGAGGLRDITAESGVSSRRGVGASAGFVDHDLLPDLVVAAFDGPVRFYRNLGACRFVDETAGSGLQAHPRNEGVVLADLDADGDLDLYVTNYDGENRLYRNTLDDPRFLKIVLEGGTTGTVAAALKGPGRAGEGPILASQEVSVGGGYCSQAPREVLFRTPDRRPYDVVLRWAPGQPELTLTELSPGSAHRVLPPDRK